jgi:hypothetical protein
MRTIPENDISKRTMKDISKTMSGWVVTNTRF